jgi:hypothetical protein
VKLINDKMHDGSRNFILLPVGSTAPVRLLLRVMTLWGAFPTAYIPGFSESWIDFRYKKYKFSINNQYGDFWFFVEQSNCPEEILIEIANHFAGVLGENP